MFTPSSRLQTVTSYAFAEVEERVRALKAQGITPIDFGVGDPVEATPAFIRDALKKAADEFSNTGYPLYNGRAKFRQAVSEYTRLRFNVELDPDTEICSTVGSKEAIFHFPEILINRGDVVLIPSPGYPPYKRGTTFSEGARYFYPLLEKNNFCPDFEALPVEVVKATKLLWLCYPNNPTGAIANRTFFEKAVKFAKENNIIIASDECYVDVYMGEQKPCSILEVTKENVIAFNSLSKRSNMTGYRIGWVAGDKAIVAAFKKLKTNIDSGTPDFIQSAAIAALGNEEHVEVQRRMYRERADVLTEAFRKMGLKPASIGGAFYLWQRVPEGMTSVEFAQKLLQPDIAIVVTPGSWISDECIGQNGEKINPGEGYVRFALVPNLEQTKEAAKRLVKNFG